MTTAKKEFVSTISQERISARTLGCVGFSILAHLAFLAAIAIFPESFPVITGENAAHRGTPASDTNEIAMVELQAPATSAPAVMASAPARAATPAVMNDDASEVIMPTNTTKVSVVIPKPKATPKVQEKVEARAVETAQNDEPMPVLLADPPSDSTPLPQEEVTPVAEEQPEPKQEAKLAAIPEPAPEPERAVTPVVVAETKNTSTTSNHSEKSTEESSEAVTDAPDTSESSNANTGATDKQATGTAAGSPDEQATGTAATTLSGPVRDASELRALSGNPNPIYPARDRLAKKEGTSVLLGRISADGRVSNVTLERSSGSTMMDSASIQAFQRWRFQPGQQGLVRKPFQFKLVGAAKEVPAPLAKTLGR